jgi:predicted  nucleic acid-binding Zn-ribbon protein
LLIDFRGARILRFLVFYKSGKEIFKNPTVEPKPVATDIGNKPKRKKNDKDISSLDPQKNSILVSPTGLEANPLEKKYRELSSRFKEEWVNYRERVEKLKALLVEMIRAVEEMHPSWIRRKVLKKIADDNKGLEGFESRTLYRGYELLEPTIKSSRHVQTNAINTSVTAHPRRLVDQEELEKANQRLQSVQIELSQKKQAIMSLEAQLAGTRTALKNVQRDMQKGAKAKEWDQDEIEIAVARERPDGTILHRDIVAIMAKKPPVFYIKAYIVKKGKAISANAIDVNM